MRPIDESVASTEHYGPSVVKKLEIPMVNGGDMMLPLSPCVDADFSRVSLGIPKSKYFHAITKINKLAYENGYDLNGELGPFLDTVEGER